MADCQYYLAPAAGLKVLEAGPANPRVFGGFLRERGWEYTSIDRWKTGNPRDPRAVGFVDFEADLTDLSIFADGEFNLFLAQHVIEEIEDYTQALDEIRRVLSSSGHALLEIPFSSTREKSERQPPDHFGNVWLFGQDLIAELSERFETVDAIELAEGQYRGTLLICGGGPEPKALGSTSESAQPLEVPLTVAENARAGDDLWWVGRKAPAGAIEGYASWPSVEPGGQLELHVSTSPAARYVVTIHRLGWYGGKGGRLVSTHPATGDVQGVPQLTPPVTSGPQVPSCQWPITDTVRIGRDWPSGQYVAKLSINEGELRENIAFVPFVVRAPLDQRADILIQMPVTTAQAYNDWGGKSLYPSNSTDGVPAVKVTFDRPFASWHKSNPNARWPFIWDFNLIRYLEREGYDVAYTTDLDTHREPWGLLGHPVVMTSGHDEYWSREMRDAFEAVKESGASLACMGANTCYWQARFEDGERTMVEYRHAIADPVTDTALKTIKFRELDPPRPECLLWGVQYQDGLDPPRVRRDYELTAACDGDPWLEGTGFEHPATLHGLVGYEWDAVMAGLEPADGTAFFHHEDPVSNADVVRHTTAAGGIVFAAGSLQFSWGLDGWNTDGLGDPRLQRFMKNGLDEMIAVGKLATQS